MLVWNQQVRLYQMVDGWIAHFESFLGLSSVYLTLIMGIVMLVFWFARRQHSISLTVLTAAQVCQLSDFKNYLDRELVLNKSE
jgi:hypothetical protein